MCMNLTFSEPGGAQFVMANWIKNQDLLSKSEVAPGRIQGPALNSYFLMTEFLWLEISPGSVPNPELLEMPRLPSDLVCLHQGQVEKPLLLQSKTR